MEHNRHIHRHQPRNTSCRSGIFYFFVGRLRGCGSCDKHGLQHRGHTLFPSASDEHGVRSPPAGSGEDEVQGEVDGRAAAGAAGPGLPDASRSDAERAGRSGGRHLLRRHGAGGLQQPHLGRPQRGRPGQVRHLLADRLPGAVEPGPLRRAAAQALGARAAAGAPEPERVHPHRQLRGFAEGEGVCQSAAEEPGPTGNLLMD